MVDYVTGAMWGTGSVPDTLPSWQRDYYSMLLLETLRMKSILVPYCTVKEDFAAANSGIINFTEVYDTEPNPAALTETSIWLTGGHLDSRKVTLGLEIHGDILKFSDYTEIVQYINKGDMRGLVSEKIGQNQVDYLDLLARNAFLAHPHPNYMGTATTRATLAQTDLFDPDICETIRVHLEENNIPGVFGPNDDANAGPTIVCITTPRVIKDIRTSATSKWLEVQEYAGPNRKFNNEVGMWAGIRFVKSNRMKLFSAIGSVAQQTTLNGATVVGSGATVSQDGYTVGQTGAAVNVVVTASSGFAVGDWVTIGVPAMPIETDSPAWRVCRSPCLPDMGYFTDDSLAMNGRASQNRS